MKSITAGYLLKVTTWENDGDNYNTEEVSGLTKAEVRLYIEICKLFECGDGKFGNCDIARYGIYNGPIEGPYPEKKNEYESDNDLKLPLTIKNIVDEFHKNNGYIPMPWDYTNPKYMECKTHDDYMSLFSDALGNLGLAAWNEGEMWRVFEKYEVYLVPCGGIPNVTDKFKDA